MRSRFRARTTGQGTYYRATKARLYDRPAQQVPIYIAAAGPKSARPAGQYGDGWITDQKSFMKPEMQAAFREGALAAGKNPDTMPKILETFVVVGGREEAEAGAQLWRFTAKPWKPGYVDDPDEADIQRRAEAETPLDEVYTDWPVGESADVHAEAIKKLAGMGATHIFVHTPQADRLKVVDFYGQQVLPQL